MAEDEWFEIPEGTDWSKALAIAGLFRSRSQAKKNGWDKPIDAGFDVFTFGKLRHEVAVLFVPPD
jgi:hypothetical protein